MERAHTMTLRVVPLDGAGGTLYERIGSTQVGICREMGSLDGARVDIVVREKVL
jgi:hypothetical protein